MKEMVLFYVVTMVVGLWLAVGIGIDLAIEHWKRRKAGTMRVTIQKRGEKRTFDLDLEEGRALDWMLETVEDAYGPRHGDKPRAMLGYLQDMTRHGWQPGEV